MSSVRILTTNTGDVLLEKYSFFTRRQYFRFYCNNRCAFCSCLYKGVLSDASASVFARISESLHFRFAFAREVVTGVVIASKKYKLLYRPL